VGDVLFWVLVGMDISFGAVADGVGVLRWEWELMFLDSVPMVYLIDFLMSN
jgi:hypothetical protein